MFETTLRYNGLNNRHAVEGELPRYDSVIIDAKMLAHSRKALPQFIQTLSDERSVEYYIEPIVSDFRAGDDFRYPDGTLRGWYDKYVQILGDPVETILEEQTNISPETLTPETIAEIATAVVAFQEDFIPHQLEQESGKYVEVTPEAVRPKAVIPWHHRIAEQADIEYNRTILDASLSEAAIDVKPCLHTTKAFIRDTANRTELVDLLADFDITECFLLIEELGKHETDESTYTSVIDLVYDLAEAGIRPHFYYGDFFSNLLAYFGVGGTTYGVMYGEEYKETVEYSDSGGILPRYYVDEIKDFLKVPAAVELMKATETDMCSCAVCQRQFENWDDLIVLQESEDNLMNPLQKHYVERRWRHARLVEERSFESVLEQIDVAFNEYVPAYADARQISPNKDFDYLPRWMNALKSRSGLAVETIEEKWPNRA